MVIKNCGASPKAEVKQKNTQALTFPKLPALSCDLELYSQRWLLIDCKIGSLCEALLAGWAMQRRTIGILVGLKVMCESSMQYWLVELKNAPDLHLCVAEGCIPSCGLSRVVQLWRTPSISAADVTSLQTAQRVLPFSINSLIGVLFF